MLLKLLLGTLLFGCLLLLVLLLVSIEPKYDSIPDNEDILGLLGKSIGLFVNEKGGRVVVLLLSFNVSLVSLSNIWVSGDVKGVV